MVLFEDGTMVYPADAIGSCLLGFGSGLTHCQKEGTVNPEYFVCMIFSCISYAAASVRK